MSVSLLFRRLCCTNTARDLKNKVVVVTGAAIGIGYEIASKFLQCGAKTAVLLDVDEELGCKAMQQLNAQYGCDKSVFFKCDVTTDIEAITSHLLYCYEVDVLVNNAGLLDEVDPKKVIDINVTGSVLLALKFWEYMRTDKCGRGGTIINLSSIWGYRVDPFFPVYKCTKYAMMGFTKSLGHIQNFNRSGVRVVAICPGFTETKMTEAPILWDPSFSEEFKNFVKCQLWQKVEAVGDAAVNVFHTADSGTAWLIEGGKPITAV